MTHVSYPCSDLDDASDNSSHRRVQIRAGLKLYSNWPTYPQLYVHGSLIGGLDIVQEMVDDNPGESLAAQFGL